MGGKSGGQAYTPVEHPDNLQSAQIAEIIDLLGEGEIAQDLDLKRIYLNDTPVQNADGTNNFQGVEFVANKGTRDQLPLAGFENTLRTVQVGVRVKKRDTIVREVSDPAVTSLILTLGVNALVNTTEQGDRLTTSVSMLVEFVKDGVSVYQERVTFEGKTTSQYYADDVYDNLPKVPFSIRITRIDADATTDRLQNQTYFVSYTEVINAKLSYPHSVVVGIKADSAQFGNQIPTRKYLVKGLVINVPDNYDPETRTYTGFWSGAFKPAWTNNPAWVFYDAVTNDRYGLGDKIGGFECDKWALYQIARYCDEMVDDGYGGKEPRMTCNLHITDQREGYEVLSDLASIFRGISMWTGNVLTVANDRVTEPVAIYTNANVVDGLFSRSFVAKRAMTSVVHVSYMDKREMYRQKTEYVSDDELVKRYGENVKSVTAYGCTSRGQAARLGRWIIETSKRERQTITFTVGREGLKHLPFDVIQVSDKYWANEMVGGRVVAVSGKNVTLDVEVKNAVGGTLIYMGSGGQVALNIAGLSADKKTVTLAAVPAGLSVGGVWSMIPASGVQPQLFRCLSIGENGDAGTYTVTAVVHDPDKDAMVDKGVKFTTGGRTSNYTLKPEVYNPNVIINGNAMTLTFDSNVSGGNVEYEFTVYRDGKIVRSPVVQKSPEFVLSGLGNGNYIVKARAKGDYGYSDYLEYGFTVDFNVTGLRATPKTLSIDLAWDWPDTVVSKIAAQIWYATVDDASKATLLATVPYPQNTYTLTGVGVADTFYFWARGVSEVGDYGELTPSVKGRADNDPAPIIAQIQGAITKSELSQALIEQLGDDMAAAADEAVAAEAGQRSRAIADEAKQRAHALQAEAAARTKAIQAEQAARVAAVKAAADKAAGDLLAKSSELGTRITATENVNKTQAQQISTVTASQGQTAAGLEAEKRARADGDRAEAQARETLAARVGSAEGAINELKRTTVSAEGAESIFNRHLTARMAVKDTRNDNQPPTWYWNNYPKQTVQELKFASVMGVAASSFVVVNTEVPWLNGSGGAIVQTATTNDGKTYRRLSDVAYTYQNGTYTYTKDLWGDWVEQETAAGAQAKADAVKLIADAAQRLASSTNAEITKLQKTVSDNDKARAEESRAMTARFDNLSIGGRNLLRDSGTQRQSAEYLNRYRITDAPAIGEDVTVTLWGQLGDDRTDFGVYNSVGFNELAKLKKVADGLYRATFKWKQHDANKNVGNDWANGTHLNIYAYPHTGTSENRIDRIKLERGNLGSDWTPAPEDAATKAAATEAALNEFKSAQATKDEAVTNELRDAKSRIGQNESNITELRNTRATKTEVVSLARSGLQSEWQGFATQAKEQAVATAQADATAKANAAKLAAETAAQAKADAAKAAAVAAAGSDATAKANAAKAQAIADAAAKDAAVKQQAADDAKAKADAAKAEAIAEARKLNNATNAEITKLQKTVSDNDKARVDDSRAMTARFDSLAVGGRNLLRDSGTQRQSAAYLQTFSLTEAPKVGDTVTVTLWGQLGEDRTDFGVYNTQGFTELAKLKKVEEGKYRATFVWKHPVIPESHAWKQIDETLNIYAYPRTGTSENRIDRIKLERGNLGSDWTPAPEDAETKAAATEAALNEFKAAQATKDTAETKRVDTALSRIGTAEAKLTTTQQTVAGLDGKVQSLYTLKAETLSGGRKAVSALMMGADGQTADSQILLMADKVAFVQPNTKAITPMMTVTRDGMAINGNLVADGTILGRHLAANQTIESPVINGATVNAGTLKGGHINIGNGNFIVDWHGNLYAKNGRFDGEVRAESIIGLVNEFINIPPVTGWDVINNDGPRMLKRKIYRAWIGRHNQRAVLKLYDFVVNGVVGFKIKVDNGLFHPSMANHHQDNGSSPFRMWGMGNDWQLSRMLRPVGVYSTPDGIPMVGSHGRDSENYREHTPIAYRFPLSYLNPGVHEVSIEVYAKFPGEYETDSHISAMVTYYR